MFPLDPGILEIVNLIEEMNHFGLFLSEEGKVRIPSTGKYASGEKLLEFFGTPKGVLEASGEGRQRAERLINLFHKMFSNERTFGIQHVYGREHFIKSAERSKLRFSNIPRTRCLTVEKLVYEGLLGKSITTAHSSDMDPELNLAMCMYWSYSVNAPGMALKIISKVVDSIDRRKPDWGSTFAKLLVFKLGTSSYGRWDDDIKGGRYQRTRSELMKFFKSELFIPGAIMPKDFPGA
jgi:hypothetical protein